MNLLRSHSFLVFVLAVVAGAQAWLSLREKSMTFDELTYIPAGYTYVVTRDFRLNPEHPPLSKLLAGAALLTEEPRLDLSHPSWESAEQWDFGRHFFQTAEADTARLVSVARIPTVILLMAMVILAYYLAAELYSPRGGLIAAALCAISPNLLAHGRLATTDFVQAFMVLATAYAFVRFVGKPTVGRAVLAGIALGLALLTKYSAVLLVGLVVVWAVAAAVRRPRRRPAWRGRTGTLWEAWREDFPEAAATFGGGLLGILAVATLVVSLGYGTPGNPLPFLDGLRTLYTNVHVDLPTYFAGRFHPDGLWYYFIVAFLLKTPVAFLALLGLRVADQAWRRQLDADEALYLLLPALLWFVVMTVSALQFGVRYVLPAYPLLFVYVSGIVSSPLFLRFWGKALVAVLVCVFAASSVSTHPHYIPYFNVLAGGPANGIEWLDDSNVDWGQDLPLLAEWLDENDVQDATIVPMALYDPGLYGVEGTVALPQEVLPTLSSPDPEPGVYAVSAHLLTRVRWGGEPEVDPLRDLEPRAVLGHSIYVFDIPER